MQGEWRSDSYQAEVGKYFAVYHFASFEFWIIREKIRNLGNSWDRSRLCKVKKKISVIIKIAPTNLPWNQHFKKGKKNTKNKLKGQFSAVLQMSTGGPSWEKNDSGREAAFQELMAKIKIPELKKYMSMKYLMLFFLQKGEKIKNHDHDEVHWWN